MPVASPDKYDEPGCDAICYTGPGDLTALRGTWSLINNFTAARFVGGVENAEARSAGRSGELATRVAFQAMTCPIRALSTGRTSEIQAISLVAIARTCHSLAVATGCTGRRCSSDCWPSSAALPPVRCGSSGFRFNQGSQRLSRSSKPKGHQIGG